MEDVKKRDLWSDRETREMLSIVNEKHIMELIDGKKRNKSIFEDISSDLKKKDIFKSHIQVRNKFKSLKSDFYKAKRNNNKSGAKRQTSEHYEMLDEIFGSRPALEAQGVDVSKLEYEDMNIETILEEYEESLQTHTEEPQTNTEDESVVENEPPPKKQRTFKRTGKKSYENTVKSFTMEWKESQQELLQNIKEHDQDLMNQQKQQQEELLQKSMESMEKILEKDRQETAKMLQGFLAAMQPMQPNFPYTFNASFNEPSSSNITTVLLPKTSPQDSNSNN